MDVGQPHMAAVEKVSEPLVVETEQVQQRGMDIVVGNDLFGRLVSKFIVTLPPKTSPV